jgi:hypothetical protein
MYAARRWAVRHSGSLEFFYNRLFEPVMVWLHPLWQWFGYERVETPVVVVEKALKGLLFDCQMCGHCVLSATGMSCPMNCPKRLRNGPCGGVRPNGHCEVKPAMRCVWVEAWEGSQRMRQGLAIQTLQRPVPFHHQGSSAWLRVAREKGTQRLQQRQEQ